MEWTFCDSNGNPVKNDIGYQIDLVGNIYQAKGGIMPKACQNCKSIFKSELVLEPIKQEVPFYKCQNCKFENASANAAFDHTLERKTHKIKKTKSERIVSTIVTLKGNNSHIEKTIDDILILCNECK